LARQSLFETDAYYAQMYEFEQRSRCPAEARPRIIEVRVRNVLSGAKPLEDEPRFTFIKMYRDFGMSELGREPSPLPLLFANRDEDADFRIRREIGDASVHPTSVGPTST
jgi:hypothetical protein